MLVRQSIYATTRMLSNRTAVKGTKSVSLSLWRWLASAMRTSHFASAASRRASSAAVEAWRHGPAQFRHVCGDREGIAHERRFREDRLRPQVRRGPRRSHRRPARHRIDRAGGGFQDPGTTCSWDGSYKGRVIDIQPVLPACKPLHGRGFERVMGCLDTGNPCPAGNGVFHL